MPSKTVFFTKPLPKRQGYPRTLAEFKSWLQQPGVMIACVRHDLTSASRDVQTIQSVDNLGWTFKSGQRCLFRSARAWSFKHDEATLTLSAETLHRRDGASITYRLIYPN